MSITAETPFERDRREMKEIRRLEDKVREAEVITDAAHQARYLWNKFRRLYEDIDRTIDEIDRKKQLKEKGQQNGK
jgi:hypothetical protein